ncbi:MAG TPA: 4-alpha-glucanotransferase [Methylomirabilota bacterium]|nr:4-alpha-glucanotransferase [Methylomirabilota bacterium]
MTDVWGIADGYHDAFGEWRVPSPATREALRRAMGAEGEAPPPAPVLVRRAGESIDIPEPARLVLEDGAAIDFDGRLPVDVPPGYHELLPRDDGPPIRLIVSPGRCVVPARRGWGWAAQVYATRSSASWGIGDLADLKRLGRWAAELGASTILINPLSAPLPVRTQDASPYYPSSRRFVNPLYLRIDDVPGARAVGAEFERLAALGKALDGDRTIDRGRVFDLKMEALERIWEAGPPADTELDRYLHERDASLRDFSIFCVLSERHGRGWRAWPAEYRRPDSPEVARFAEAHASRVRFHQWVQWLLDRQLAAACAEIGIMQDLPIGVDPDGADAWAWQDVLATGTSVGAPPDRFVTRGQDWGLPPFVPHRLRALAYGPFVETIRAGLRHARGLRIDHVMGLFRLFWVPHGLPPAEGGYVRYPAQELLAIVALESQRAGATIVGEDLGTVEDGVRETLAAHGVLSYRVMWFEDHPPARYPALAMAAVTTHDLPTVGGLWTGADFAEQRALGLGGSDDPHEGTRARLAELTGRARDAAVTEVIEAAHARLAEAPSLLVTATLDDALAVRERPNVPGTSLERPNWSLALPLPLERLETSPLARRIAEILNARSG